MADQPNLSLAAARNQGKLDQFAKDRETDPPGDEEAFNRALQSMAGRSKEAPTASKPECGDD